MRSAWLHPHVGLSNCQGNQRLYEQVLTGFYQQHQPSTAALQEAIERGDLPYVQELAHALKSVANSIGAMPLAELAKQLAPPAHAPNQADMEALLAALQETNRSIAELLPTSLDTSIQAQLMQLIEQHNLAALRCFQQWRQQAPAQFSTDDLDAIEADLANFDFKQAAQQLNAKI